LSAVDALGLLKNKLNGIKSISEDIVLQATVS